MVRFADGSADHYDVLLNTMPLTELIPILDGYHGRGPQSPRARFPGAAACSSAWALPGHVRATSAGSTSLRKTTPFYRITYLSRYSPYMAPDENHFSIITETSSSIWKPENRHTIVERTIDGLIATGILEASDRGLLVDKTLIETPYAYPDSDRSSRSGTWRIAALPYGPGNPLSR